MSIAFKKTGDVVTLQISGVFDYGLRGDFMRAIRGSQNKITYIVDLTHASHINSAGLGMLMMLREMAGGNHTCVSLVNANNQVKQILVMAQFQDLFKLA